MVQDSSWKVNSVTHYKVAINYGVPTNPVFMRLYRSASAHDLNELCAMIYFNVEVNTMAKRTGSGGRPPYGTPQGSKSRQLNLTIPLDLNARLEKFCEDDERAKSWAVQKALDKWLSEKGY